MTASVSARDTSSRGAAHPGPDDRVRSEAHGHGRALASPFEVLDVHPGLDAGSSVPHPGGVAPTRIEAGGTAGSETGGEEQGEEARHGSCMSGVRED